MIKLFNFIVRIVNPIVLIFIGYPAMALVHIVMSPLYLQEFIEKLSKGKK